MKVDLPEGLELMESEGSFQARVKPWLIECFGEAISADRVHRYHRFLEEALELVQATGCSADEAHQLVEYVYGRPKGEIGQEVGGVMTTLASLCLAHGLDMHTAGEAELARVWTKVEQIRAKQATKPRLMARP
jgi:NTP pyrophosphatase (non-canonical NTP hydrolase)